MDQQAVYGCRTVSVGSLKGKQHSVVGSGLVGCLAAAMLAKEGWKVDLYEARPDPRSGQQKGNARSINLAISSRGIEALKAVREDFAARVLQGLLPMKGRMIHTPDGKKQSQKYGLHGECINSVDRALLNKNILDEVEKLPEVSLHFQHKLLRANFDQDELVFLVDGQQKTVHAPFVVGCDGAFSKVREQMMRASRMDFEQRYIPHAYLELSMPPIKDALDQPAFALEPDHLHIWPRHDFMLIALPNEDKSFTSTFFAPFETFDKLKTEDQILAFFKTNFPDALPLIGEQALYRCFRENPTSPLLSVKCLPYHYKDKAILLGDSSHCMVPFYGQGANCGFEDVAIFQNMLHASACLSDALEAYTTARHPSLMAIQRLAQNNYHEMASKTVDRLFLLRKRIDALLTRVLGDRVWLPLYTMVTFRPDLRYEEAEAREARQAHLIEQVLKVGFGTAAAGLGLVGWWWARRAR